MTSGEPHSAGAPCIDHSCTQFPLRHLLDCADRPQATLILESVPFVLSQTDPTIRSAKVWGPSVGNLSTLLVQELVLAGVAGIDELLPLIHILQPPLPTVPLTDQSFDIQLGAMRLHPLQHRTCPHSLHGDSYNTPFASGVRLGSDIESLLLPIATQWRRVLAGISLYGSRYVSKLREHRTFGRSILD